MFAEMVITPSGHFWVRVQMIGATPEELAAYGTDTLPEHRREEIAFRTRAALLTLSHTEPEGHC